MANNRIRANIFINLKQIPYHLCFKKLKNIQQFSTLATYLVFNNIRQKTNLIWLCILLKQYHSVCSSPV